ncbi:unnamed protein product [Acanthoscelides obtectus]|uniref:Uncharacterized protein n=1 Tax=Acanthoscelides obtectus TaxID=200917 RepID=A0A9P0LLN3_ACAOB|nr:unnamed protein product [Acanthoscelides obtectus]CAK1683307.1 hypothetical protein AOBTE_LOCUS34195 [Acanthoscelides obtectus]
MCRKELLLVLYSIMLRRAWDFDLVEQDPDEDIENHESDELSLRQLEKISQSPLEPYDCKYHVEIVSNLKDKNRLKDFNEIAIVAQFDVSPLMEIDIQQFATSVTQNFSGDIAATEMDVIEFQYWNGGIKLYSKR